MTQFLIAIDQTINTMVGGWADETLSARAHRCNWRIRSVINAVFFWQDDHCRASYESERQRRQLPLEYRHANR